MAPSPSFRPPTDGRGASQVVPPGGLVILPSSVTGPKTCLARSIPTLLAGAEVLGATNAVFRRLCNNYEEAPWHWVLSM
jgi:hypothetical protein